MGLPEQVLISGVCFRGGAGHFIGFVDFRLMDA